jgi:hypothetical protein
MDNLTYSGKKEKINFLVPQEYVARANQLAKEFDSSLSDLLRRALLNLIEDLERKKIEREVEIACKNYYEFNKQFSKEWANFETRIE